MDVAAHLGRNLAKCRKRANLSQDELGVRASVHRTEVGMVERGERLPRVDTLVKLAGGLSIPPGDLLDGIVWKPGSTTPGEFSGGE